MKTNKEMIEELKTKAVDWQTEDDGSGHKGETTYTFYLADIEQLLIKHEEAVVERMSEIVANSRTIEEKYGQGNRELNARVQILFDMKNKL